MSLRRPKFLHTITVAFAVMLPLASSAVAVTVQEITEKNRPSIQGKEVDWIDGDYILMNDQIVVVIARPGKTRDANMTTRAVGACIIDLTRNDIQSDQLTAFYPTGGRYQFNDDADVQHGKLDDGGVYWRCQSSSPVADNKTTCTVEYRLLPGAPSVTATIRIDGEDLSKIVPSDGVRADRTFKFSTIRKSMIAYCEDTHFRQAYGIEPLQAQKPPVWGGNRPKRIAYVGAGTLDENKQSLTWSVDVTPASSLLDLWGLKRNAAAQTFSVAGAIGDQPRIKLSVVDGDVGTLGSRAQWRCDTSPGNPIAKSIVHLPPGDYRIKAEAIGHEPTEHDVKITDAAATHPITLGDATTVSFKVTDGSNKPIPCKVSFYGAKSDDGKATSSPDFGVDSQDGSVGNTVYSIDGKFVRSVPPGTYDVVVSHGPEYDADFRQITIAKNNSLDLNVQLNHVIDTKGWVSAELHSHSSPSGDNTSSQRGRVENLVCENLEFAPCTEHQRIESYDDHLQALGASQMMFTCSGMELTGNPLPINHQNAFPLKWKPFQQDGGGPRVSSNPVTQIARLAMWDDNSDKVVQTNHPNIRQMVSDRNLDGKNDGGFEKMFDFMDVIEVHPPQDIFRTPDSYKDQKARDKNSITPWLNLIKNGRRIPGVVNTDAHYNWHGSGWLRNWIASDSDYPTKITIEQMIANLSAGRVIMSTGPFMTVQLHHDQLDKPAEIGDIVNVTGDGKLAVRIQCPNWLDINRVEVFVDGEMQSNLSRTRTKHGDQFGDQVVKFDQKLPLKLTSGSFIVVAAIGEKLQLGRVMGKQYGKFPPVVVSNPIYIK